MRSCRMNTAYVQFLMKIVAEYHHTVGILGEGRLHAEPFFERPVLVPHGLSSLYRSILEECLEANHAGGRITDYLVKEHGLEYMMLKGTDMKFV